MHGLQGPTRDPQLHAPGRQASPARCMLQAQAQACGARVRDALQVLDFASIAKRHCRVVACSAVSGAGLLDGFDWLVKDISSRIYLFDH